MRPVQTECGSKLWING